jgi:hypothetical protein
MKMNRKTTMAESLIDIAVSKGIRDMKECSDRGFAIWSIWGNGFRKGMHSRTSFLLRNGYLKIRNQLIIN